MSCPICKDREKPCERFVSAAHIFKHYGVPLPKPPQVVVILSRRHP